MNDEDEVWAYLCLVAGFGGLWTYIVVQSPVPIDFGLAVGFISYFLLRFVMELKRWNP